MCGICGAVGPRATVERVSAGALKLVHRGPDQSGIVHRGQAVLGHRRLSILDLSVAGRQPMSNEDESVWLVFNGEIYNFQELRRQLESRHVFHSRTDSEVLIHGYQEWGIEGLLGRIRGMFAFAIWDCAKEHLYLARDHFGKKPVFYSTSGGGIAFASSITSLLEIVGSTPSICLGAIVEYLNLRHVPAPGTILDGIHQLQPATYLKYSCDGDPEVRQYWQLDFTSKLNLTEAEWLERIQCELERSVKERLVADVRVGAFLSGGIDSSMVASMMGEFGERPPITITMRFPQEEVDESSHARTMAHYLNSEHHECDFTPAMLDSLPRMVWHFGQPFADPAAVPTFFLSQYAAQYVKVVTTGDGGDEAFAGYPTIPAALLAQHLRHFPGVKSGFVASGLSWLESQGLRLARGPRWIAETARGGDGNYRPASGASFRHYPNILGPAFGPGPSSHDWAAGYSQSWNRSAKLDWADRALATDILTLLPNALLTKIDVMTMAHSIEARSPFLDLGVMELAARIPSKVKLRGYRTKYLLKRLAGRSLPKVLLSRPKHGFIVPMDHWFRHELKNCSREILLSASARKRGLIDPQTASLLLSEHESGKANHGRRLWLILLLELWCRIFLDKDVQPSDSLNEIGFRPLARRAC